MKALQTIEAIERLINDHQFTNKMIRDYTGTRHPYAVRDYANDLLASLKDIDEYYRHEYDDEYMFITESLALNGAADWQQYSEDGSALCYNTQVAERLHLSPRTTPETLFAEQAKELRNAWRLIYRLLPKSYGKSSARAIPVNLVR